ncbi:hypothetical protein M407DRAFT_28386 [Tulasnella calospora MUT 4182]|uniref:Elongator complex protein 2 n=1 Tax=Tulasnella calospora MUT 4182 TaxID=1051891 RepID=A0A0C3LKZ2_9AGAM|nr:hypothetical protein M407DRAFT_28386 [Tulasnella calospora MUT 4182]
MANLSQQGGLNTRTVFISASTNRYGSAADCSAETGHVAFGTRRLVGLWDASWKIFAEKQAHDKSGVTALCAFGNFIVSGGSDAKVKVWDLQEDKLELVQTLDTKGRFPLDIKLACLPQSSAMVMAVAATDRVIRIFVHTKDGFTPAVNLEGHEDWIRCLAFDSADVSSNGHDALTLASGSQDGYIRLWVFKPKAETISKQAGLDDVLAAFEASLGDFAEGEEGGKRISNRSHVLSVRSNDGSMKQFTITFDALLVGHENHVTTVSWQQVPKSGSESTSPPTLLSSSTDASLILWSPTDSPTSIWVNRQRFGDVIGAKAGGFVGALWSLNGDEVMGWGWNGCWRRWRCAKDEAGKETWTEVPAITGHHEPVKGLAWDPNGDYIITSSLDQTTRIFGPWRRPADNSTIETWHELARPQIHGYDLIAPDFINSLRFVTTGDEKVARVFDAPRGFVRTLKGLGVTTIHNESESERPIGASVPPLGLSNKAAVDDDETFRERDAQPVTVPPCEGELASTTLWPEVEKLFGHGYELYALGVSHSGSVVATACKSTTPEHAVIRLYDSGTWRPLGEPLPGHTLTVTRIAFSPDDRFILSTSRDRTWRLFERQAEGGYRPIASEKGHARIIWDCAWSKVGGLFATAGRDKLVKVWQPTDGTCAKWKAIATIKLEEAATAVDFALVGESRHRLAIGLENGNVAIYSAPFGEPGSWSLELVVDPSLLPVEQIHRLAWRTKPNAPAESSELAVASEEGSVRIITLVSATT